MFYLVRLMWLGTRVALGRTKLPFELETIEKKVGLGEDCKEKLADR